MCPIEALSCPKCGSSDITDSSPNRYRCNHCGATLEISGHTNDLSILEWVCPKCNFNNDKDSAYCGKCGEILKRKCPNCMAYIRWDLDCCPQCGFKLESGESVLFSEETNRFATTLTNSRIIFADHAPIGGKTYTYHLKEIRKVRKKGIGVLRRLELKIKGKLLPGVVSCSSKEKQQELFHLLDQTRKSTARYTEKAIINHSYTASESKKIQNQNQISNPSSDNSTRKPGISTGLLLLCLFIPFVGLWIWYKERKENKSKATMVLILSIIPTLVFFNMVSNKSYRTPSVEQAELSPSSSSTSNTGTQSSTTRPQSPEWWEVEGTLHNASALDWQNASYANKLATCGNLMCTMYENGLLSQRISGDFDNRNMDDVRFWADSLVIVLDIAMERFPDAAENERVYANQTVSEVAAITLMMSNWLK